MQHDATNIATCRVYCTLPSWIKMNLRGNVQAKNWQGCNVKNHKTCTRISYMIYGTWRIPIPPNFKGNQPPVINDAIGVSHGFPAFWWPVGAQWQWYFFKEQVEQVWTTTSCRPSTVKKWYEMYTISYYTCMYYNVYIYKYIYIQYHSMTPRWFWHSRIFWTSGTSCNKFANFSPTWTCKLNIHSPTRYAFPDDIESNIKLKKIPIRLTEEQLK